MPDLECRREGVRVAVRNDDHIEAIIYNKNGAPEFCDEYEINLGGIKVNSDLSNFIDKKVKISLFDNKNHRVEIDSTIVTVSVKNSVLKFAPLNEQQHTTLCLMLRLQQPI